MCLYKYSFSFNAAHSNTNDKTKMHTHSFIVSIIIKYQEHTAYDIFEKEIKVYLKGLKGKYLNDIISDATIENVALHIFNNLDLIIGDNLLYGVELCDSPVQKFILYRED